MFRKSDTDMWRLLDFKLNVLWCFFSEKESGHSEESADKKQSIDGTQEVVEIKESDMESVKTETINESTEMEVINLL